MRLTWVEISRSRLEHNLRIIRSRIPASTEIIAVVKANAYGHGVENVSQWLRGAGVQRFAVATLEEALQLRQWIKEESILVFTGYQKGDGDVYRENRLTASVYDWRPVPSDIPVEVKIDTGMTRLGISWTEAASFLADSQLNVQAVFSHFASADVDPGFSLLQIKRFLKATDGFDYKRHISNSAGLRLSEAHLDAVRLGLSLYGISPGPDLGPLQPILSWKSRILTIKTVSPGNIVGYGGTFSTRRKTRVGILPCGYADGYSRFFSNQGRVGIGDSFAPVIGRVSMDMTTIDLSDFPHTREGDEVTLIGSDPGSPLSASNLASSLATIPYEVLTSIGNRVERIPVD